MKDRLDAILRRPQAEYLARLLPERDALLARVEQYAAENDQPIADPEVAQMMRILLSAGRARHVLEIGTNIGYSVIVLGREIDTGGMLETIEIDAPTLAVAKGFVDEAELSCTVRFHHGAALEVLPGLEGPFDFVFIDCVKTEYNDYLLQVVPKVKVGGMIVADNVLWKGQVAEGARSEDQKASTAALAQFNGTITTDERLLSTILPVGDGLSISIRVA